MKSFYKILFLFFFLYANTICAQSNKSFNLMGLSEYMINGNSSGNSYVFTMHKSTDELDNPDNIKFSVSPLTKESFTKNFFRSFAKFQNKISEGQNGLIVPGAAKLTYDITKSETEKLKAPGYKLLEDEATKLFYLFVAKSIVFDDLGNEPIAGTIFYVDSLMNVREDIDHQPLAINVHIKRLWKLYKKEKKALNKVLESGAFGESIDDYSNEEINEAIATYNKGQPPAEQLEPHSGTFSFHELISSLSRRKFKSRFQKKIEKKNLKKRAHTQKVNHAKALKDVNDKTQELKINNDSIIIYNNILGIIDSVEAIDKKEQILFELLKKDYVKIEDDLKSIGIIKNNIYNEIKEGIKSPDDWPNHFDKTEFHKSLDILNNTLIKPFRACLYSDPNKTEIKWRKKDCDNISSIIYYAIEREKSQIQDYIHLEKENLANIKSKLSDPSIIGDNKRKLEKGSDIISINLRTFKNTIQNFDSLFSAIKGDTLYNDISSYYNHAQEMVRLYDRQLELINQIALSQVKSNLHSNVMGLSDYPIFSPSTVSIPKGINNTYTPSPLIPVLNDVKKVMGDSISILNAEKKTLEESRDENIEELAKKEDLLIFKRFKVDSIVIEINEGFIENILMVGKVDEYTDKYGHLKVASNGEIVRSTRTLKFENTSPIGFSRKLDFDAIKGKKLITRGGGQTQYEMYIEDILTYVQQHEVGRRDYSPANQKVVLKRNEVGTAQLSMGLKKEATYQLFEAKIFSDFVGLDETAPNGLIQTEISKRINLLTNRTSFRFLRVAGLPNIWNVGILSYIEPSLTLSKIEGNNKYLLLNSKDRFINNQYAPIKFTSTLQLKQFENFSASATANILLLDMPNIKSTFFVNWGFRYGRTGIQDSIRTATNGIVDVNKEAVLEYGVNTFDHSPELIWSVYADERYGFSMSWQHHWFYLRDNQFEQVANTTFFENQVSNSSKTSKQYNTFRFLTTLEQSSSNKGRLFFRYTYNWQQGFWNTGFHQAQVGYSFYLLGRPKD